MTLAEIISMEDYSNVSVNNIDCIANSLVFLYPAWSGSQVLLNLLLTCLKEEKITIPLVVLDIDQPTFLTFSKDFSVKSNGYGEMYFIQKGSIVLKIEKFSACADKQVLNFVKEAAKISLQSH